MFPNFTFMWKLLLALVFMCLELHSLNAQQWKVGFKAGVSLPNLRASSSDDGSFSSGYKSLAGLQAGIMAEYIINDKFSVQTELNYSTQGGEKNGDQRLRTAGFESYFPTGTTIPPYLYARFDNKIELKYVELPIMAKYSFQVSERTKISVLGGLYAGYLLKAGNKSVGKSKLYRDPAFTQEYVPYILDFNREEDIIDQCNKINYGFQGGGMLTYDLDNFEVFFSGGGTYGFRYLQKDAKFGQNKTGGASICVGAAFKL